MPKKPSPPDRTEELRASYRGGKGRPRELRITTLYRGDDRVPFLRIAGHWLNDNGFAAGSRLTVTAEPGKLTLTLATHPAAVDAPPPRN